MKRKFAFRGRSLIARPDVGKILLPVLLLVAFLAVRLPALGRYVTADEALWLRGSANFYFAITHGKWEDTFLSSHPGVTTLWAGAIGFKTVFPEYRELGESEISDFQLRHLLLRNGHNPIEVLAAARAALVAANAVVFLALWPYARRLLGTLSAALGLALLAFDPFLVGLQRLLHQDGLLSSLMLLALLAYITYLQDGKRSDLAISGVAAGLSWLTKTTGWFLVLTIFALALWQLRNSRITRGERLKDFLISTLGWVLIAFLTMIAVFPALWISPGEELASMLSYSLDSVQGNYSGPVFFLGNIYLDGNMGSESALFYPLSFLWRNTPITLFGLILVAWFSFRDAKARETNHLQTILSLALFTLFFAVLMSAATKKFDRYLLPAHLPMILIAGWGWRQMAGRLGQKWQKGVSSVAVSVLIILVISLQLYSAAGESPYFLTYYNPVLGENSRARQVMMLGWGEGLDQAANYLNQQAGIENRDVSAWYSSSFNLLFGHDAGHIWITPNLAQEELDALLAKDYLVVYIHQWQRGTPQNLLDELEALEPVQRVWINGIEYARVYRLFDE